MTNEIAHRAAQLAQERVRLLTRVAVIDKELIANLPTLLVGITAQQDRPLRLVELVVLAAEAGHVPKSKALLPILVQQALILLVQKGVLKKDKKNHGYCIAAGKKEK